MQIYEHTNSEGTFSIQRIANDKDWCAYLDSFMLVTGRGCEEVLKLLLANSLDARPPKKLFLDTSKCVLPKHLYLWHQPNHY